MDKKIVNPTKYGFVHCNAHKIRGGNAGKNQNRRRGMVRSSAALYEVRTYKMFRILRYVVSILNGGVNQQ